MWTIKIRSVVGGRMILAFFVCPRASSRGLAGNRGTARALRLHAVPPARAMAARLAYRDAVAALNPARADVLHPQACIPPRRVTWPLCSVTGPPCAAGVAWMRGLACRYLVPWAARRPLPAAGAFRCRRRECSRLRAGRGSCPSTCAFRESSDPSRRPPLAAYMPGQSSGDSWMPRRWRQFSRARPV